MRKGEEKKKLQRESNKRDFLITLPVVYFSLLLFLLLLLLKVENLSMYF